MLSTRLSHAVVHDIVVVPELGVGIGSLALSCLSRRTVWAAVATTQQKRGSVREPRETASWFGADRIDYRE